MPWEPWDLDPQALEMRGMDLELRERPCPLHLDRGCGGSGSCPKPLWLYSVSPPVQSHFKEGLHMFPVDLSLVHQHFFKNSSYLPISTNQNISHLKGFLVSLEVLRDVAT